MKLYLYGIKDIVAGETSFIFPAKNDKDLRRTIKSAIIAKSPLFCDNVQDKQVYLVAQLETDTGVVIGLEQPVFMVAVQEVLDELIIEIKAHNQKMKDAGLDSSAVEVPDDGRKEESGEKV